MVGSTRMTEAPARISYQPDAFSETLDPPFNDQRSLRTGLRLLATHYALYFATLAGALAPLPIPVAIACAIANGVFIAMLFIIGHDGAHGSLVPGRSWNEAAMSAVVTDDEQHGDEDAIGNGAGDGNGNRQRSKRTRKGRKIKRVMSRKETQARSKRPLIVERWIEGLGKRVRLIGDPRRGLGHSCRSNHSKANGKIG